MEKVIFTNENFEQLFVVIGSQLNGFILPRKGELVTWMRQEFKVVTVEHNYDLKVIEIQLKPH